MGDFILRNPGPVFFVPTMGFLHDGHACLIRMAASDRDSFEERGTVVMSLFVNPTQFNNLNDLEKYPRDEERDMKIARESGCDLMFSPTIQEIYPNGLATTKVVVSEITKRWEGEFRPGHFDGVATVVNKLFNIVLPDYAYFGEKDWQQCAVISKMVQDLDIQVWLKFGETIREEDGLAMSSRNSLLNNEDRKSAPLLYRTMQKCAEWIREGKSVKSCIEESRSRLAEAFSVIDYFAYVNEFNLEPLENYFETGRLIVAAHIGGIRLIDNLKV